MNNEDTNGCCKRASLHKPHVEIVSRPDMLAMKYAAWVTRGKTEDQLSMIESEPSRVFLERMLEVKHSPIRCLSYMIIMYDVPYYVSVHYSRHKIGVEHFVKSQRPNIDRSIARQGALVTHAMYLNVDALCTILSRRLCTKADKHTQELAQKIREAFVKEDELYDYYLPRPCRCCVNCCIQKCLSDAEESDLARRV